MSDPDDTLEDELRALLSRVLSVQLDALEKRSEELSVAISRLVRTSNEVPKQLNELFEKLLEQCDDDARSLKATVIQCNEALALQMQHLNCALAETRTALGAQSQESQQVLVGATISSATKVIEELRFALNILQQRGDERSGSLDNATVRLVQSFNNNSALTQSRLSVLERRIILLNCMSITGVVVLVVAVAGAGAIYLGVASRWFPS